MKKQRRGNARSGDPGTCLHATLLDRYGAPLLITASYQVLSLCVTSGAAAAPDVPGFPSPAISTVPAVVPLPQINECRCVGGCIACTGLSSGRAQPSAGAPAAGALTPVQAAARAAHQAGVTACDRKDWDTAIAKFTEAFRLWPQNVIYKHNLAVAKNEKGVGLYQMRKYADAARWFSDASQLDPDEQIYRNNLKNANDAVALAAKDAALDQGVVNAANSVRQALSVIAATPNFDGQQGAAAPAGGLDFMQKPGAAAPPSAGVAPAQPPSTLDFMPAKPAQLTAKPTSRPGIDRIYVPPPVLPDADIKAKTATLSREQARTAIRKKLQSPRVQAALKDALAARAGGDAAQADLRAKAALERARTAAIADVRRQIVEEEDLRAMLATWSADDPRLLKAMKAEEGRLRAAEEEADRLMRAGLVPREYFAEFDLLFSRGPRIWPGPKNPDAPLTNPLVEDAKRQKLAQLILWNRRQNERLIAVFDDPAFQDQMVKDLLERSKSIK